ncbi:MAG: hypothetical protein ABIG87_02035 [Patescibacteria group bacterium]
MKNITFGWCFSFVVPKFKKQGQPAFGKSSLFVFTWTSNVQVIKATCRADKSKQTGGFWRSQNPPQLKGNARASDAFYLGMLFPSGVDAFSFPPVYLIIPVSSP